LNSAKFTVNASRSDICRLSIVLISVCYLALFVLALPIWAETGGQSVIRDDNSQLGIALNLPLYTWQLPKAAPKAVIVTIHGVTLHGGVFDKLASTLAEEGYVVVSPDLRGFGRWCLGKDKFADDGRVSFYKSRADLIRLLANLKSKYAGLPIFCVGESLGANLALWLASACPQNVDGVIMSSPCVKRKLDLCVPLVVDSLKAAVDPERQILIRPYARRYLSEDPLIVEDYLNDPLIRKTMSGYESLQSLHTARSTLWFVDQIPANIPVLALEGTNDRMFEAKQLNPLMRKLKTSDKKIYWLKGKGHIHLETPRVSAEVSKTILTWLGEHSNSGKAGSHEPALLSTSDSLSPGQEEN
jgi:alpha-beta hydrolase superfamily lysophospholipase